MVLNCTTHVYPKKTPLTLSITLLTKNIKNLMRKLFGKLLQKDEHTNEWASEGCFVIVCDQNQKNQSKKQSDQTDTLNGRQTETIS